MNIAAIGSSTGGPAALRRLFSGMPRLDACFVIVQHMPAFINPQVCGSLQNATDMQVMLAEDGEDLVPGRIIMAPSDVHMHIVDNRHIHLEKGEKVNYVCPAIDVMMMSLQRRRGDSLIAVVLTGIGSDGAAGLRHIKTQGGLTLAQDAETSVIYGMPKAAVETGCVDYEGSPEAICEALVERFGGQTEGAGKRCSGTVILPR